MSNFSTPQNDGAKIAAPDGAISVSAGDKIQLYATCSEIADDNYLMLNSTSEYCVYGNIMSLISEDNYINTETVFSNAFNMLFWSDENLTDAENLILPATTLAESCYEYMFAYCTGLTTAPKLPATTLANKCYEYMFLGCTKLEEAPVLPAPTLVESCYKEMFYNCSSLQSITCLATDISAEACTDNWVSGVAASGTFYKSSENTSWTTPASVGLPSGWTIQNADT